MNGTPLVALSLVSTFLLCVAAKDGSQAGQNGILQDGNAAAPRISMKSWTLEDILAKHKKSKRSYTRFFRVPSTHCGVYTLPKGGKDGQSPHAEDELYYIISGKAKMESEGKTVPVKAGSLLFIAAGAKHRFIDIESDLELLVIFSSGPRQDAAKPGLKQDAAKAAPATARKDAAK